MSNNTTTFFYFGQPAAILSVTPTATPSQTPCPSITPSFTLSVTPTSSITPTPTLTKSITPTPSPSRTPPVTPCATRTPTPSPTVTATLSPTASVTPTPSISYSPSASLSPTPSPTLTPSITPSISLSITPCPTPTPTTSAPGVLALGDWEIVSVPNFSVQNDQMYNTLTVSRWSNDTAYQIVLYPAQQVQQGGNVNSSIKSTTTIDVTGGWSEVNGRGYNWWAAAAYAPDIGANGKYVAVPYLSGSPGGSWDFMVSTDLALSWSSVTPPVRNSWNDIIWSQDDNQFVALAGAGYTDLTGGGVKRVAISSDGSTWTKVTTPSANNYGPDWWSLAYGNGTYVAVARSYSGGPTDRLIMSSSDALNWTTRSMPVSGSLRSVAYGNGTFVATSEDLSIILTSSDGATWTQQTSPNFGTQGTFFNLEYGGGIFCALACPSSETSSLTAMAVWSTDGINWNAKTIPTPARQWGLLKGLAYGRTDSFTGFYALARYGRSWSGSAPYDANQTLLMRAPILNPLPEPSPTVTPSISPSPTPSG